MKEWWTSRRRVELWGCEGNKDKWVTVYYAEDIKFSFGGVGTCTPTRSEAQPYFFVN